MKCLKWSEKFLLSLPLEIMYTSPCHMDNLFEWETSICEIRRYTRTIFLSIHRTSHTTHIGPSTRYKEWCKCILSFFFSSLLNIWISDIFLPIIRNKRYGEILLSLWRWKYGHDNTTLPYIEPIIARFESTYDSIRREFFPDNTFWYEIFCH